VQHLAARMHAAIGSARAGDADRRAGDLGKGGLERILHRTAAWLGLPAEKATAVVLES
jgi:hypothetical protein